MDKSDVAVPLTVSDRRRDSESNHIIRIRTAHARREFLPWGIFRTKKSFPLVPEPKGKRRFSLDSELTRGFQFASPEDFNETSKTIKGLQLSQSGLFQRLDTELKMKLKKPVLSRSKIKSAKSVNTRSVKRFKKETPGKQKRSISKVNPEKNKNFTTVQKTKTSKSRSDKELSTVKNKSRNIKQEKMLSVQQSKSTQDLMTLAQWLQENIETLERPITPKDLAVLKLLDGLKIPDRGKENVQKNHHERTGKYPIHVLRCSKAAKLAPEKGEQENTYLEKGTSEEFEFKDSRSLFDKTQEICPDAEMRITELGKLQIILNPNSFKPEDVAVIIWLNEIPKSYMKPDYRKRLSITSLSKIQPPEKPTVLKSVSSPELEDIASPKPQIYFPPVTILKNLTVDSKGELRDLKEASSAVFYKRCNLIHVDSLHS